MRFKSLELTRLVLRSLAALLFVSAGIAHFLKPALYARMVPPEFPLPHLLVLVSGVCEIAGGIGLMTSTMRRPAGWGLIALLISVFPANIYMAMHPEIFAIAPWLLWARLPLQLVLGAWVWFVALQREPAS